MKKALLIFLAALLALEICPAAAESAGTWICPACGAGAAGNFCFNCGAARPEGGDALPGQAEEVIRINGDLRLEMNVGFEQNALLST